MNNYAEIGSALDIYADVASQENDEGHRLKVKSKNEKVKKELEDLYYNVIGIDSKVWKYMRTACMYGDGFGELVLNKDENAVVGLKWLPPKTMYRVEENGRLRGFLQEVPQGEPTRFMPFEMIHFRIEGTVATFEPYGYSILEEARRSWRQLKLMEDAMVVYRVSRAPERRVFKIYTGNLPPAQAEQHVERQRLRFRKRSFVNQRTGQYDNRANSMAPDEDFWVPTRSDGTGTEIDTLPGAENLGEIDDVKYFKDKIFAALKIPRVYLQDPDGGGTPQERANLAQQDIHFARTVERVQSQMVEGFKKIGMVHLLLRGYKKEEVDDFQIELTPPSDLAERLELELLETKFRLVRDMTDFGLSRLYISKRYFNIEETQWKKMFPVSKAEKDFMEAVADDEGGVANPYEAEEQEIEDMELESLKESVREQQQRFYNRFIYEGELAGVNPNKRKIEKRQSAKALVIKAQELLVERQKHQEEREKYLKEQEQNTQS